MTDCDKTRVYSLVITIFAAGGFLFSFGFFHGEIEPAPVGITLENIEPVVQNPAPVVQSDVVYDFALPTPTNFITYIPLTNKHKDWIDQLEWCESRNNHNAINPEDLDGKPRYGAFQFAPSTLLYFGKMYGFISTGVTEEELMETDTIFDYHLQRETVEAMIRNGVDLTTQFPACTRMYGLPSE